MKPSSRLLVLVLALALVGVFAPRPAAAQVFLTQEQALRLAFPQGATVERRTAYLSEAQLEQARRLAGDAVPVESGIVNYYVATVGGRAVAAAYFDAHRVRTLPEVLMVVVGPDERVTRIEVLKFSEPPDYLAPGGWLELFPGRRLEPGLAKGEIPNITGATLTATAVRDAARRVLALHRVLRPLATSTAPGTP